MQHSEKKILIKHEKNTSHAEPIVNTGLQALQPHCVLRLPQHACHSLPTQIACLFLFPGTNMKNINQITHISWNQDIKIVDYSIFDKSMQKIN